ncbi:histidine kinase N-terminal 7TM domain-containing protein [Acetobacterium wieringae]|nr:histidine kinase N-terminal 7TM domain-containing protein [Acetobacterium wieringae]URN84156.1 hypothetical protein CHL1_003334 [Acetobacterium wieringae]
MNIILSTILVVSSMVLIVLGIVGFRHRGISGVKAITLLMFAMAIHSFAYGMELMSSDWETMYQWIRVEYLGVSFYPILILWFAREYAGERRFANNYAMGIVLAICTATLFLVETNAMHGLYYAQMGVDRSIGFPIVMTQKGQWYMVQVGALYFAMIYALVVLIGQILNTRGVTRRRAFLVFTGMLVPMIASTCYLLGWGIGEIDLIPFSFIFLSVLVASGIYRYDILF